MSSEVKVGQVYEAKGRCTVSGFATDEGDDRVAVRHHPSGRAATISRSNLAAHWTLVSEASAPSRSPVSVLGDVVRAEGLHTIDWRGEGHAATCRGCRLMHAFALALEAEATGGAGEGNKPT